MAYSTKQNRGEELRLTYLTKGAFTPEDLDWIWTGFG